MTKAYISGPISDVFNAPVIFEDAKKALISVFDWEVFNPINIAPPLTKEERGEFQKVGEWAYYMKRGIRELLECDCLVLLPGYKDSKGSMIEKKLAEDLNLSVYRLHQIIEEAEFVR
jgi:hypothetical protein